MAPDPRVDEGLRRLEAALRAAEAPVVEHLRPGREAGEVAARLEDAGLTVTPDVRSWFAWHDGCSSSGSYGPDRGFLYDHPFPGLDEVLDRRSGEEGRVLLEHEREMRGWRAEDVGRDQPASMLDGPPTRLSM